MVLVFRAVKALSQDLQANGFVPAVVTSRRERADAAVEVRRAAELEQEAKKQKGGPAELRV